MRRYLLAVLLVFTLIGTAGIGSLAWHLSTRGVHVTVINSGPDALSELTIHITGNSYRIGTLAKGESRTVRVIPQSETHIELTFIDAVGQDHGLNAGGYFENGYHGRIEIELENGAIKRNEHDVRISLF